MKPWTVLMTSMRRTGQEAAGTLRSLRGDGAPGALSAASSGGTAGEGTEPEGDATGLAFCDPVGRVQHWNATLAHWFPDLAGTWSQGRPAEDLLAGLRGHADLLRPTGAPFGAAAAPAPRPALRQLVVDIVPLLDGGRLLLFTDVTALRAEDARAHLERLQAALAREASAAVHDVNNQLQVIASNAELARAGLAPGDLRLEALADITEAVEQATRLTRRLLGGARGHGNNGQA